MASQDYVVDAHGDLHRGLEEMLYECLAVLVQSDVGRARRVFENFALILVEHMAFEEEHVLPRYTALAPADGPGRADHVAGDHVILLRHVEAITALFDELAPDVTLRQLLEKLPVFYRLLGTLEHHTAREQRHVYPSLAEEQIDDVTSALRALAKRVVAA